MTLRENKPGLMTHKQRLYSHPTTEGVLEVWQDEKHRWLAFADGPPQSMMSLAASGQMLLATAKAMQAGLLFHPAPERVLLLGLGGGDMIRLLQQQAPTATIDAVEISDAIITIYEKYFVPPHTGHHEHTPLTIHHADANSDIKHLRATYPLIIIDIFNNDQLPNFMGNATFYQRYKSYLTDDGVIIFNLSAPDKDAILQQILLIRQQFHKHTLFVPVKHSHNLIMLAFKHPPNDKNDQWLQEAMAEAARQHMDLGCTFEELKALNISNGQQQLALFSNQ